MMRDVLRIALKDFQIQKNSVLKYVITGLVFVVVFYLIGGEQNQMLFSVVSFILIYRFINITLYEDEKSNSLRLMVSLPIRRDTIVQARYLSTGIFTIALAVIMWAALALTGMLSGEEGSMTAIIVMCSFLIFTIMISVYMPLGFKLGYSKAVNINKFLFIGMFALFGAIPLVLDKLGGSPIPEAVVKLDSMLETADPVLALTGFALFSVLVYIVSMRISIGFFRKRELF